MASIAILGVPVDLGASRRGVEMGPSAVRLARLAEHLEKLGHTVVDTGDVTVPTRETLGAASGIEFLPTITAICRETARRTAALVREGHVPVVLGGDHSLSVGSVAGVATALAERGQRLGLIWLDAHADINTPGSTLSGNIHGMPVAHLIGRGDPGLAALATPSPAILPRHVAIVGARDLDPAEQTHVREFGVAIYTMRDIDERGMRVVLEEAVAKVSDGTSGIYASLDLGLSGSEGGAGGRHTSPRWRDLPRGSPDHGDVVGHRQAGRLRPRRGQPGARPRQPHRRTGRRTDGERLRAANPVAGDDRPSMERNGSK